MKPIYNIISAFIILLSGYIIELQAKPLPQGGIYTISPSPFGEGAGGNCSKPFACLPFPTRKRWLTYILHKRVWRKS